MNENAAPPPPPPSGSEPPEPPGSASSQPPPIDPPGSGADGVSSNRSIMIVLSYLWLLAIVPLLFEKDDREVQWHAKHGLVLFGVEVLIWVLASALSTVVACLSCVFVPIVSVAFLVVRILCMVKGLNGTRFNVPLITDLVDKF